MLAERLEVRLDHERRLKPEKLVAARGVPVSKLMRAMIDEAYEETLREERLRAVVELGELNVEDVPDPEVLSRQMESTYDLCHLP